MTPFFRFRQSISAALDYPRLKYYNLFDPLLTWLFENDTLSRIWSIRELVAWVLPVMDGQTVHSSRRCLPSGG